MSKKLMSIILALVVIVGMMPMAAMAEVGGDVTKSILVFEDMPQDWSTEALENAIENGLLNGSNGKILPNDNLTRAEMAAIINRSFKSHKEASLEEFKDVLPEAWYYKEMAKAVQMKTFQGNKGLLNPDAPITREEAFAVISRAFKVENTKKSPKGYSDLSDISVWAREEVYGLINAGYVQGSNGMIKPKETITRAEFAQLMYNIVKEYLNKPEEYTTVAKGNVMINVPGVILKDATIDGDLIIGDGVGIEDVTLDNVTINGRLVVRGGEDSITIKGQSKIDRVLVAKVDGVVEIKIEKDAEVEKIVIESKETTIKGLGKVKKVEVKEGANDSAIETPDTEISIEKGVIGTIGTGGAKIKEDTTVKNNSDVTKAPETKESTSSGGRSGGGGGGGGGGGSSSDPTPSETPEDKLAKRIDEEYSKVQIPNNAATISFNKAKREFTITINEDKENIEEILAGTKAMVVLTEIKEITGYKDGDSDVSFANKSKAEIKDQIIADTLIKIGKGEIPTNLKELKGKEFKVTIKARIDDKDIADEYTFIIK